MVRYKRCYGLQQLSGSHKFIGDAYRHACGRNANLADRLWRCLPVSDQCIASVSKQSKCFIDAEWFVAYFWNADERQLSSRFKKIRFFHRVSNTFAAMKYSTLLKQAIANELTGTQAELCLRMLKESSRLALLKNLEWLLAWDSSRNEIDRLSVPIHQLHGRNDTFFDAPIPSEATLLGNAGHLLWFSHSRSVLEWIDAVARA